MAEKMACDELRAAAVELFTPLGDNFPPVFFPLSGTRTFFAEPGFHCGFSAGENDECLIEAICFPDSFQERTSVCDGTIPESAGQRRRRAA